MITLWQHQKNMCVQNAEEALEVQRSLCFNQQANVPKQQMAIILGTRRLATARKKSMCVQNAEEVSEVRRSLCFKHQENAPRRQMAIILGTRNLKKVHQNPFCFVTLNCYYAKGFYFMQTPLCPFELI